MHLGLTGRILVAGGIVCVFLLVEFGLVIRGVDVITAATRAEQRATQTVLAASRVEKLVLDLETGARGYVITRDQRFLEPWRQARVQLPAAARSLVELSGTPEARRIDVLSQAYLRDYSVPLVAETRSDPALARSEVASGKGKRLVDAIRAQIDPLIARDLQVARTRRARVLTAQHRGLIVAGAGILITILLFAGIVTYFLRAAVVPLRRLAEATVTLTGGERDVVVDESGAGEVATVLRAFNELSRALSRSERSLAEQNVDLERLANVLRAVLDSTVDGILLSDAEGNVQLANRPIVTLTRAFGMAFEGPVVDRLISVADRMSDPDAYREAMERLRVNSDAPTFDEFEDAVTGRVYQGFTAPVRDDRGGFLGRIWTLRDVTQQRELDRLKDDFVATVSHELRTPLTSMMGFLEMLREGEAGALTEEQEKFLAIVYRSSERLQRLVGDLLFVARLDANGLQLQFADVRFDDVVRESVESTAALARAREIELVATLAVVPPVFADRDRLAQLTANLISNAIKFTPAGGRVDVRTMVEGEQVVLEVEDTGIGIPAAEQDRVFERFFRSSTATEQAIPGTGLGLVISRAIAEAHGGSIAMRSEPGRGTCFRVVLPPAEDDGG